MNFHGRYQDLIQPDKIHVLSVSILIDQLKDSYGGTAANIAYSLALLGDSPILLGSIGERDQAYLNKLKGDGVNTKYVHESQLPTATFTVMTDSEDNQVGGFYPGAMSDRAGQSLEPWSAQNPFVVISAGDPSLMSQYTHECITHKLRYAYDVGQQVTNIGNEDVQAGLSHCQILFVNDYELELTAKKAGLSIKELESKIPLIVTTLGKSGSRLSGSSLSAEIQVRPVPGVMPLDPTGAGDAYRAGFLYGYLRGWQADKCARLGSVVAAYTVETHGTQEHHFSFQQVSDRYYQTYKEKI